MASNLAPIEVSKTASWFSPLDKYSALPPELHLRISEYFDPSDFRSLIFVSHRFYNLFARDVLIMGLHECISRETILYSYTTDYPFRKLFKGSFERLKLEPKFRSKPEQVVIQRPFVIRDVYYTSSGSTNVTGSIKLKIYQPPFFRKDYHTKDLDIYVDHDDEVYLLHSDSNRLSYQSKDWEPGAPDLEEERFKMVELEDMVGHGTFIGRVTGKVLRANWQCPECGDGKYMCPDCGGAWDRYVPSDQYGSSWSVSHLHALTVIFFHPQKPTTIQSL